MKGSDRHADLGRFMQGAWKINPEWNGDLGNARGQSQGRDRFTQRLAYPRTRRCQPPPASDTDADPSPTRSPTPGLAAWETENCRSRKRSSLPMCRQNSAASSLHGGTSEPRMLAVDESGAPIEPPSAETPTPSVTPLGETWRRRRTKPTRVPAPAHPARARRQRHDLSRYNGARHLNCPRSESKLPIGRSEGVLPDP